MLPSIARVTLIWCETSLRRQLSRTAGKLRLDDVHGVELVDTGLQRLLGGDAFVDRSGEMLKHLVAQQRPQARLVALRKGRDDHLEGGACTLDKVRWVEARIGPTNSADPLGDDVRGDPIIGRPGRRACRVQRASLRCRRRLAPHGAKKVAAPLVSGPTAEHAAQPQHQKTGNHRKQDDVEIVLKFAHRLPRPVTVPKARRTGPYTVFGSNGAPARPRQAPPADGNGGRLGSTLSSTNPRLPAIDRASPSILLRHGQTDVTRFFSPTRRDPGYEIHISSRPTGRAPRSRLLFASHLRLSEVAVITHWGFIRP